MTAVFRLAPELITPAWSILEPIIASALKGQETHNTEDVRQLLMTMQCHGWIQVDEETNSIQALVVTEFTRYPRGLWLRLWLAGVADGCHLEDNMFYEVLDKWRVDMGCREFEIIGRPGWSRRFNTRILGVIMRGVR